MSDPISRREAAQRLALLFGGALSAPTLAGLLGGCRASSDPAYAYAALNADQQALTGRLVDLIIPATDTPGAKAAGVPAFIDKMLAEWMTPEDKAAFLAGLTGLDARARRDQGAAFVDLDDTRQAAFLTALDREAYPTAPPPPAPAGEPAARAEDAPPDSSDLAALERAQSGQANMEQRAREEAGPGAPSEGPAGDPQAAPPAAPEPAAPPFFRRLKELTLAGYYTSEVGANQELRWLQSAPGNVYRADVALADVNGGRAWA